jgi:hypothetical protein
MGILVFKWLIARRLYKSFGDKGLITLVFTFLHVLMFPISATVGDTIATMLQTKTGP